MKDLAREIDCLLDVYNNITNDKVSIGSDPLIYLKLVGQYIHSSYSSEWTDTVMSCGSFNIYFKVFKNTEHENRVGIFLKALENVIKSTYHDRVVIDYLDTTNDFTENEIVICRQYHEKMSNMSKQVSRCSFTQENPTSNDNIETYSNEVNEFNDFIKKNSGISTNMKVIEKFNIILRKLSQDMVKPVLKF